MKVDGEMKCEYLIGLVWIVAYVITVTCSTLMPEVLIILALILLFVYYILKNISIISMWIKDWLNGKWIITIIILVIVVFFALWYNGVICIHAIAGYNSNLCSKESAELSYYVVNTISGILTPLLSLGAVIAAFVTLYRQRKQNAIQNFENHLFQMIDQQHKLEKKVVNEHGSFRELYEDFSKICSYVFYDEDFNEVVKGNDKRNEIGLKIANYIFYFGADKDFLCDKTFQILTGKYYGLDQKKLKAFIIKLIGPNNSTIYDLFHTQKSEELGIYYRNLFNAIRYIDWECPEEDKKEYYAKLVRTNLSDFAQLMLYYNMQGERGKAWLDEKEVKNPKHTYSVMKNGKQVDIKDCLLTRYKPIKNCAISVKQLDDKQIQEILEIHSNESDQKNKTEIIPCISEISRMEKKLDIDPRNDGRKVLFSDDVIDYELKIGKQDN